MHGSIASLSKVVRRDIWWRGGRRSSGFHQFARGLFHMRRLHLVFRRFRFIFATGARGDAIGTPPSGAAKCALFLKFGTVGEDGNNSNRG
jgi:hypothetical protein